MFVTPAVGSSKSYGSQYFLEEVKGYAVVQEMGISNKGT